jgi:crotonobetainyl-CoA:carnitine CoA-transferase CaiB-like acyl-CoA transferase
VRPLEGYRVLDLSRVLSGPIAGRVLCDLGADVIKVEPPEGDLTRFAQPKVGSISLYYAQQNTGKRNVSIDLRSSEGVELLLQLAEHVDVVIENFRPGVMDRLGLGWDALHERNPHLVLVSISGYGQTGAWRDRRAYAVVVHAEMGLLAAGGRWRADAAGVPDEAERFVAQDPMSHADVYAGLHAANAAMAALLQRGRTGEGQHVDVDMAEALLAVNDFAHWELTDADAGDHRPSLAPVYSPILHTADGRAVVVAGDPCAPGTFERWCRIVGRPELADDPAFAFPARRERRTEILTMVREWARGVPDPGALEALVAPEEIAVGVVRSVGEAARSDWAQERGAVVDVDDRSGGAISIPEAPWRFSGAESGVHGVPAYRGEHNREVLAELLGLDDARLDRLEADRVLSSRPPRR